VVFVRGATRETRGLVLARRWDGDAPALRAWTLRATGSAGEGGEAGGRGAVRRGPGGGGRGARDRGRGRRSIDGGDFVSPGVATRGVSARRRGASLTRGDRDLHGEGHASHCDVGVWRGGCDVRGVCDNTARGRRARARDAGEIARGDGGRGGSAIRMPPRDWSREIESASSVPEPSFLGSRREGGSHRLVGRSEIASFFWHQSECVFSLEKVYFPIHTRSLRMPISTHSSRSAHPVSTKVERARACLGRFLPLATPPLASSPRVASADSRSASARRAAPGAARGAPRDRSARRVPARRGTRARRVRLFVEKGRLAGGGKCASTIK
jgi:hypothetical protein